MSCSGSPFGLTPPRRPPAAPPTPPFLDIFAQHGIHDIAVHWIEGAVEPLVGPPVMMRVAKDTDPTHWIRRALTAVLGIPLAAEELEDKDAQGSLGVFFHEGKD